MRWSLELGKIFGIRLRVHWTFLLLLLFVFLAASSEKGTAAAAWAVAFICAVFACVVVHELAHSLIGRRFGVQAKSITLLPIGGIAAMEEIPRKPAQEIAIAIIGPFINLAIAGLLYLAFGRWTGIGMPNLFPTSPREFLAGLIGVNVLLAIFNMIPAFPMDGGRVLRGLLAMNMGYLRATSIAVTVGHAVSALFVFYGIFFNWWLAIIGIFLYLGADSEKQQTVVREALHGVPASAAMATQFEVLHPGEPLARSLQHVYHGYQEDFPVIGDGGLEGILTRTGMIASIHRQGTDAPVGSAMDRDFLAVGPDTPLDEVYRHLMTKQKTAAAVVEGDHLLGMLSLEGIGRFFMLRSAVKDHHPTA
ncbi:MAG: site-2 protease family protein [Phycisphaerae bacterium]|jgi:Zn-dependent protease